jgi:hypothetical protein
MQNKANFRKSQVNINSVITSEYEQMDTWSSGKNKAKTKPIQTQTNPIQTQYKANSNPNKPNFLAPLEYFVGGPVPFRFAVGAGPGNRRIHLHIMKEKTHLKIALRWLL